jgi:protein-tyrosine kinase
MSRIHDALKQATADRSTGAEGQLVPTSPGIDPETVTRDTSERERAAVLRFEDLVTRCTGRQWVPDTTPELSRCGELGKIGAEGFRTLRSRLYQMSGTRRLRRIVVTSSLPGEGKTFIATNLAHSIVRQPERKALLIDADLRASGARRASGSAGIVRGLSDYLMGEAEECDIIQSSQEGNLCFVSSGSSVPNPSELLLGARMKELLTRLTPLFDWVILDSPPTLAVHDASSLADLCDGVLFVVKAGTTSHESAQKAALEFRNKNLLGVVLNCVETDELQESYYGYPTTTS